MAALLGDLVAYRARGASHLEVVAGKPQLSLKGFSLTASWIVGSFTSLHDHLLL